MLQPTVAVTKELERDRVNAGVPEVLARGERRQFTKVGEREVPADIRDAGRGEVEIIEQPLRGRGDELARSHIVCQRAIRAAQHPDVVLEPGKDIQRPASSIRMNREAGGERERTLLEAPGAEQFVAQRLLRWRRTRSQPPGT